MSQKKILLVEGKGDQEFFQKLCEKIDLSVEVKVNTPQDHGAERNGKPAALKLLDTLMAQLADGRITHLAMVVDADYVEDNWGYEITFQSVVKKIQLHGYIDSSSQLPGLCFPHPDGFNPFGLWIMPDNRSEGMLEDWLVKAAKEEERYLLDHAVTTVGKLTTPKFKPIHTRKAEVATWLAWQKTPGAGLDSVIWQDLMNMRAIPVEHIIQWLRRIYSPQPHM